MVLISGQESYRCNCAFRVKEFIVKVDPNCPIRHQVKTNGLHILNRRERMVTKFLVGIWLLTLLAWGEELVPAWQREVLRCAQARDWTCATAIVEREIALAPGDMDVRAWRARILTWSGKLAEAEVEYLAILTAFPRDPDDWMGLAAIYSREGRTKEALGALDRAVELDPNRADLRVARADVLRVLGAQDEAKAEFGRAVDLDPTNADGRAGLVSLRGEPRHEIRLGTENDSFNYANANQDEGLTLISQWTPRWRTSVAIDGYQWGGTTAAKFLASLTGKLASWGALTIGGATAHDNGVIPRDEGWFDYDRGLKLTRTNVLRGVEFAYGQHWYWYSTARILTINESTLFYLPREWTWSLGLTGARSQFSGTGSEWRPSGMTRLGFPITNWENHRLGGNVFFAVGTENFAQVNQIGQFSSQTYGGGLRLQLPGRQEITNFAAYQRRTQSRTELSFGLTYALHF
jgi:tetratricopeptide (TPR) repeat protein